MTGCDVPPFFQAKVPFDSSVFLSNVCSAVAVETKIWLAEAAADAMEWPGNGADFSIAAPCMMVMPPMRCTMANRLLPNAVGAAIEVGPAARIALMLKPANMTCDGISWPLALIMAWPSGQATGVALKKRLSS